MLIITAFVFIKISKTLTFGWQAKLSFREEPVNNFLRPIGERVEIDHVNHIAQF